MVLDQLRNGLTIFGVFDEMFKYLNLFESVFIFKFVKLILVIVKDCFKYLDELSDRVQEIKMMMIRFVNQLLSVRLM